jgi:hypothetical protein
MIINSFSIYFCKQFNKNNWFIYQSVNCVGTGLAKTSGGNLTGLSIPVQVIESGKPSKVVCKDSISARRVVEKSVCASASGDPHFISADGCKYHFIIHLYTRIHVDMY